MLYAELAVRRLTHLAALAWRSSDSTQGDHHVRHPPPLETSSSTRNRTLVDTGIGNALEWLDWSIYSTVAAFFAASFVAAQDPVSAFLSTLAVFAVGFVARPVGGFVFGWIGDRLGRRKSITLFPTRVRTADVAVPLALDDTVDTEAAEPGHRLIPHTGKKISRCTPHLPLAPPSSATCGWSESVLPPTLAAPTRSTWRSPTGG